MAAYFDHNATTPLSPAARAAMAQALVEMGTTPGNPSSIHQGGRRARDHVERARAQVSAQVGGAKGQLVFTSGGTEANVLGIVGAARQAAAQGRPRRMVTSVVEHPSVLAAGATLAAEGWEVTRVGVDADGRLDWDSLARELQGAALVSVALANHELGNVYDIARLSTLAHAAGALVHSDAVQALGKMAVDVRALGVDFLSLSAHKVGGPMGVGALWMRPGASILPLWPVGHQEKGLRPGTENVIGIVGFAAAAVDSAVRAGSGERERVRRLRDELEARALGIEGARRHGDAHARVDNTSNLAFWGAPGDLVVAALDLEGFCCATGAACTSGSVEPSHVILALGVAHERAREAVRFSLAADNDDDEVERLLAVLPRVIARIRTACR